MARDFKTCVAARCKKTPVARFVWPGNKEERACEHHLKRMKMLANIAGFSLLAIPLDEAEKAS